MPSSSTARSAVKRPDRERIRRGRPLEVEIGAAGNLLKTLTVTRPVPLTVRRQAEPALTAVLELDLDVASAPAGIDLDPIANDIGRFLMGLQNQTGQLEPITRGSHDQALHAGHDQALPQDAEPCTHRAIIGKITRSGRYRSGQTGLTVDQLA